MADHRLARSLVCAALGFASIIGGRAQAVDGVIEINQDRAVKGGITPDDTPGFPITISTGVGGSEAMSFRLTGPLATSSSSSIIEILSPHVTIDLNGFMISCLLPMCSGTAITSTQQNITVMNGTVLGFFEGVAVSGSGARVENVRALNNSSVGIHLGNHCTVHHNTAAANGTDGIKVGVGCTVSANTASSNVGDGICTLLGCNVTGNTARGNTGFGLNLSIGTGYSQNVISENTAGTVFGGVSAGLNVCNGSMACP
jgi:hypothetical protein